MKRYSMLLGAELGESPQGPWVKWSDVSGLLAALHLAAEALDAYSDVNDGDDGRPTPNRAMSALQDIGEALAKAEGR